MKKRKVKEEALEAVWKLEEKKKAYAEKQKAE